MNVKSGFLTTEFWVSIMTGVVTILVLVFHVPRSDAQGLADSIVAAIPIVAAVCAQAMIVYRYITGRNQLKHAAMFQRKD